MSGDGLVEARSEAIRRDNRVLLMKLGVVVVAMFGFGYALVPFYEKICEVTGLRDIDKADVVVNTQVDTTRVVRIEFDTNLHDMPWKFRALETTTDIHPGAVTQVVFEVVNTSDRPVTGQAIPSYGPRNAAQYFRKLDCFCFTRADAGSPARRGGCRSSSSSILRCRRTCRRSRCRIRSSRSKAMPGPDRSSRAYKQPRACPRAPAGGEITRVTGSHA